MEGLYGGLQGHLFGTPKAEHAHWDEAGLWGRSEGISLSEIVIPVVIPLAPGRYFSERGDAVAKASKETHVVST